MASWSEFSKRLVFGRPLRSAALGETLLPKRLALPIFSSDPLSSVSYATQEILIVLAAAGTTYYHFTSWLASIVVVVMLVVVLSYRRTVHAYQSGGGDFEVAQENFGDKAALVVGGALLTDYVLTVAVSVSAGVDAIVSLSPGANDHRVGLALALVAFLTLMNLRGIRESGKLFAIPTYGFVVGILGMIAYGTYQALTGTLNDAESANSVIHVEPGISATTTSLGLAFLLLRAFASGCTALTGVEAIANGVPAFRKPKAKNAATTLVMMGTIAITMFVGVTLLALRTKVHFVSPEHLAETLEPGYVGAPLLTPTPEDGVQRTVMAQIAAAVFGGHTTVGFLYIQVFTAGILVLAANTAFSGFPLLGSILAQNHYLPRQLHNRGDRLVYSNGIILLAGFAALLIWRFQATTTLLIQLYIIGVFVSFTIGQWGMVKYWSRRLREDPTSPATGTWRRSRAIQAFGGSLTAVVLVVQLVTKFTHGAWISVAAIVVFFLIMKFIRNHYDLVARELAPTDAEDVAPSRNHAIVLVSKVHKPTLRAVSFARATRPSTLVALTVHIDSEEVAALQDAWDRRGIDVPLVVVDSPYREITQPIVKYVKELRSRSPRDVVTVYIPEYVVGRWWEHLLHNQSALRLKARLLFEPGIMVTSVPWQLRSSQGVAEREDAAVVPAPPPLGD